MAKVFKKLLRAIKSNKVLSAIGISHDSSRLAIWDIGFRREGAVALQSAQENIEGIREAESHFPQNGLGPFLDLRLDFDGYRCMFRHTLGNAGVRDRVPQSPSPSRERGWGEVGFTVHSQCSSPPARRFRFRGCNNKSH